MKFTSQSNYTFIICLLLLSFLFLSACGGGTATENTPTPTNPPPTIPAPTPTATIPPGKVVMVSPHGVSQEQVQAGQVSLSDLSAKNGMIFEERQALQVSDIGPDWKIVVLLSPLSNLPELLAAAPQVQFVVLSPIDLGAGANLSIIRLRPENQAFLAGFIVTLIAPDWRGAGLLPSDTPMGPLLINAFSNGGHYFCGTCNTYFAPYANFPVSSSIPTGSGLQAWQSTADQLVQNVVYTMYVSPEIASRELLYYLGSKGLVLVGGQTPPGEVLNVWAASVKIDGISPIQSIWPDLLAGKGGKQVNSSLTLSDINPALLTVARQRLVAEVLQGLEKGTIYPFSIQ